MNTEQQTFLETIQSALNDKTFKRVTFSTRGKGDNQFKASFDLVLGGKKQLIRHASSNLSEDITTELDTNALLQKFKVEPIRGFRSASLFTSTRDFHYAENRKGEPRFYSTKATMRDVVQSHNKQKQYVLSEGRPYLKGLGVTDKNGRVIKKYHPKFRQIANFVEIIDRDIGEFVAQSEDPISILDLGCGKGYLTFATYDYVKGRAKHEPIGIGIDLKENVIDICNKIARQVDFNGLKFINGRIDKNQPTDIDILIALHACDTATDDALALGVRANMRHLFCAPCCQAEISRQIGRAGTAFDTISQFPLMKRREADLITDTARALILTTLGYEMKFLEFTPLEHTAKNIMLVGKKSLKVDREKAWAEYQTLKEASGFHTHSLEKNLADLLP